MRSQTVIGVRGKSIAFGSAVVASMLFASSAQASIVPPVEVSIEVNDGAMNVFSDNFMPTFSPPGPGGENYNASVNVSESNLFELTGDINASVEAPTFRLNSPFTISNTSSTTLEFIITLTMDVSSMGSSVDWSTDMALNVGFPGEISAVAGSSIWSAAIDGMVVATQFDAPFSGGFGNYNEPVQSGSFGPIMETMSTQIRFTLTAGGTVQPNGIFSATTVPAPGALAMLGVGGLMLGRSRRR